MNQYRGVVSRPRVEINTVWESLVKKEREMTAKLQKQY